MEYISTAFNQAVPLISNAITATLHTFAYIYAVGTSEPAEVCPQCKVPKEKFILKEEGARQWTDEHRIGLAKDVDPEVYEGLLKRYFGKQD